MGPCSEDLCLHWAFRFLGFISLLLMRAGKENKYNRRETEEKAMAPHSSTLAWKIPWTEEPGIHSTGVKSSGALGSGVQDSGAHVPLQGIRGGSVLFHLTKKQEADPEEVSWGFGPESKYRVLLRVHQGEDTPTWVDLQDKYQHRVHVPSVTSLRIENLTREDSGEYRARASFTGGRELTQVFLLTVYDPAPLPQILVKSASITPGWCNATLECTASRDTEDLKVTWGSMGLPREQRIMLDPPSDSWTLALSLPLGQPTASLTCVVSNQVDQKTAALDLGEICVSDSHGQVSADPLPCIIKAVVVMLLILGVGLFLWKTRGKKRKMKTERGWFHFSFPPHFPSLPH
ncbi:uncharacterized protein LOC122431705 isoform X2 [Cervus canadensis]|uniref:uncharacterized protein LOC122431705 isoform X2 n=1 Tax=Cervus canadensis TaxID=1574408 RepID=UPI001C9E3A49|nr:uncharacterized protein LOC122431705 isoform X2 [Cervus canadensis]